MIFVCRMSVMRFQHVPALDIVDSSERSHSSTGATCVSGIHLPAPAQFNRSGEAKSALHLGQYLLLIVGQWYRDLKKVACHRHTLSYH